MNRNEFLGDPSVVAFIDWMTPIVTGERAFAHQWTSPRFGSWECVSLADAYRRFEWRFSVELPDQNDVARGASFRANVAALEELSVLLRTSAGRNDVAAFLSAAEAVVGWGGVRQNLRRLRLLGAGVLSSVMDALPQLDPVTADLERLDAVANITRASARSTRSCSTTFPSTTAEWPARLAPSWCGTARKVVRQRYLDRWHSGSRPAVVRSEIHPLDPCGFRVSGPAMPGVTQTRTSGQPG
jgi:hypothetical protein